MRNSIKVFQETSAKSGEGVNDLFKKIANLILENKQKMVSITSQSFCLIARYEDNSKDFEPEQIWVQEDWEERKGHQVLLKPYTIIHLLLTHYNVYMQFWGFGRKHWSLVGKLHLNVISGALLRNSTKSLILSHR